MDVFPSMLPGFGVNSSLCRHVENNRKQWMQEHFLSPGCSRVKEVTLWLTLWKMQNEAMAHNLALKFHLLCSCDKNVKDLRAAANQVMTAKARRRVCVPKLSVPTGPDSVKAVLCQQPNMSVLLGMDHLRSVECISFVLRSCMQLESGNIECKLCVD